MALGKPKPRDQRLTDDLATRLLDAETLQMYGLKSAPKCPGPTGIHSARIGRKATVALVRMDGRLLAMCCDACVKPVAMIYGAPESAFPERRSSDAGDR